MVAVKRLSLPLLFFARRTLRSGLGLLPSVLRSKLDTFAISAECRFVLQLRKYRCVEAS